jgi:hypothetical protein
MCAHRSLPLVVRDGASQVRQDGMLRRTATNDLSVTVSPTLGSAWIAGVAESVDLFVCGGQFPLQLLRFGFEVGEL